MFHPFFDTKKLSDEELLKKINDLSKRLNLVYMTNQSHMMIDQINTMLDILNEERMERLNKQTQDMWNKQFPEIIESDPEFKSERPSLENKPVNKPSGKPANKTKNVPLVMPTFHKEYLKKDGKPKDK